MLGYILLAVCFFLLVAIGTLPVPHHRQFPLQTDDGADSFLPQTDWDAYHRAGERFQKKLVGLFLALVLVSVSAKYFLEVHIERPANPPTDGVTESASQ